MTDNVTWNPLPLLSSETISQGLVHVDILTDTGNLSNGTSWPLPNLTTTQRGQDPEGAAGPVAVVLLSLLFCAIGFVGIVGNLLVIWVIMTDRKMRSSVTNLFILNLAAADFLIMLFGVPEIAQVIVNKGWVLGPTMCRVERYVLVFSLYVSIMSLVSVCVERYIAIVHPIQAHILCSRRRIVLAISIIWPVALMLALPTVLFNVVRRPHPGFQVELCVIHFPGDHVSFRIGHQFTEFALFFFGPVVIQSILYAIICKQLFVGTNELHRRPVVSRADGHRERDSDAIRARKGVVKMLIASVMIYFFSYAPVQLPFIYSAISSRRFPGNWSFHVLVVTLGYVNSAANPILYCIFSQNFRRSFRRALCSCLRPKPGHISQTGETSLCPRGVVRFGSVRGQTATTALISEA